MEAFDEIVDCPKTGNNLCYRTQVTPELSTYLSLSCGFYTNSLMKEGEEFYNQTISGLPDLYADLAWVDPKTDLTWIPHVINQPEVGMIFANGTGVDNWGWAAVKSIEIPEEDRKNHPYPGREGEFLSHRMDMDNMKIFNEGDYIEALSFLGILPE